MRSLSVFMLTLLLLLAGCAATPKAAAPTVLGEPVTEEQVAQGEALYQANCAGCHGPEGEGEANWQQAKGDGSLRAPPHDASGHTWHHSDQYLLDLIAQGGSGPTSRMPAFGEQLTPAEREALLAYLKSFWPPDIQQAQEDITRRQP